MATQWSVRVGLIIPKGQRQAARNSASTVNGNPADAEMYTLPLSGSSGGSVTRYGALMQTTPEQAADWMATATAHGGDAKILDEHIGTDAHVAYQTFDAWISELGYHRVQTAIP